MRDKTKRRNRLKRRGLHISMPGLVTASFLDQIAKVQPLPERPYDLPTKRAKVNGAELHYFEFGEGEPVVFVHGSVGDYRIWGNQFEPFSARYRIISYSRRYHYPNVWTGDGSDYTSGLHVDDLAEFIKVLGYGPAHLIGQSWGASIVAECASRHPEEVRSLAINEPDWSPWLIELGHGALVEEWVAAVEKPTVEALAAGDVDRAMEIFVDGCVAAGTYARLSPEMRSVILDNLPELRVELRNANAFYSPFTFDDARRITAPALMIEGSRTLPIYQPTAAKFLECVPHAERVIIEGAPHAAHVVTPDQFSAVALDFLRRVDRGLARRLGPMHSA